MPFMPFNIVGMWTRGLLAVGIIAGGGYLLSRWYDDSRRPVLALVPTVPGTDGRAEPAPVPMTTRRVFRFEPGWNRPTAELAAAVALLAWATAGRWIGQRIRMLTLRPGAGPTGAGGPRDKATATATEPDVDPASERTGVVHTIRRPDGSELHIESYGPADAPTIILTHGWGADGTAWFYQKRFLADRFRLIVWDEPGAGLSKKPDTNDYRLEKMAADLAAVVEFAGSSPVILMGHSIGGMITLTLCKEQPELLGTRVAGLVLVHTTYTNPVRTTRFAPFYTAIEKPVIVPLLYLTIGLWPLAWAINWLSHLNGSAHRSTHKSSFSGGETRGQLDFIARFMPSVRPDVLARGMLGMLNYDATGALPWITVPTLVIVGDQDTTTLPEAGEFIARTAPGAKLERLAPAKHMGFFEHHVMFDRLVAHFADDCKRAKS